MSEFTYRKLATLSFNDFGETNVDAQDEQRAGGWSYAAIHRNNPRIPDSLKIADGNETDDRFVIPTLS